MAPTETIVNAGLPEEIVAQSKFETNDEQQLETFEGQASSSGPKPEETA